jgi:hypothetical protein
VDLLDRQAKQELAAITATQAQLERMAQQAQQGLLELQALAARQV